MNLTSKNTTPHPDFLELLFTHKNKTNDVFKDVLGLNNIDHIAISYIDDSYQLFSFSSTPSLEYNLFNSDLWQYDKTYQATWYGLCETASWPSLYKKEHYDDLYFQKQIKHHYPIGLSIAIKSPNAYVIYSIASHKNDEETQHQFNDHQENFYKIGDYCCKALLPLFTCHKKSNVDL